MIVYRIFENIPNRTTLGYGRAAGRWNEALYPAIYTSTVPSLCMTELYSIHGSRLGSNFYNLAVLDIQIEEQGLPFVDIHSLPEHWNSLPHSIATQKFGNEWLHSKDSLFLKVPSARLPIDIYSVEYNVLINPLHPDFGAKVTSVNKFLFKFNLNHYDSM